MTQQSIYQITMDVLNAPETGDLAIAGTGRSFQPLDTEGRFQGDFQFSYVPKTDELILHGTDPESGEFRKIENPSPVFEAELSARILFDERSYLPFDVPQFQAGSIRSFQHMSGEVEGMFTLGNTYCLFAVDARSQGISMSILLGNGGEKSA